MKYDSDIINPLQDFYSSDTYITIFWIPKKLIITDSIQVKKCVKKIKEYTYGNLGKPQVFIQTLT